MAKKPESNPISKDWGGKAFEEALKQRAAEMQARLEEERRIKGYQEILNAASQNAENLNFNIKGMASAWNASSPYYGTEAETQLAAAQQYASQLQGQQNNLVNIDPSYYQDLFKKVPVIAYGAQAPAYNRTDDLIQMPSPKVLSEYEMEMAKNSNQFARNNRNPLDFLPEVANANVFNYWKQALEHELNHIPDQRITFAEKPPVTISTHQVASAKRNLGYMGKEDHLVTGLGKIQREHYSMTGKRFESPDQFRNYIFNLASSEKPEEQIVNFSEEAKRALRPQIENAKAVKEYYNNLENWKKSKSWFKGQQPLIQGNPDFLEKSAQLIPALVSNKSYKNYTS
jgi:hypothetical protein